VNATHSPELKEMILEETLNAITCFSCGFTGVSSEPLLYHDMEKSLMFYVLPMADSSARLEAERQIEGVLHESQEATGLQHNLYFLDSMAHLKQIVETLDNVTCGDGSSLAELTAEDWKGIVDAISIPPMPWPMDHTCVYGEQISIVCFCTEPGVQVDFDKYEPDVPPDLKIECPNCEQSLIAVHCPKCNQTYTWQMAVVAHAVARQGP
jgi:hypothetical protein